VARSGPNEVAHEKPLPWWLHLWHCYKNPFNLLLTVLAVGVRVAHRQAIERILVKQRLNSMRGSSPKFLGFGLELDLRVVTEQVRRYCRRSILLKET